MADPTAPNPIYFRYRGTSMWPCFQDGDLLLACVVPFTQLRPGDCIVYEMEQGLRIVHRITVINSFARTRGDACYREDTRVVSPGLVIGRVHSRVRYGRKARVRGGTAGRFAGSLYRLAARLDASKPSRGGKAARLIQLLGNLLIGHPSGWPGASLGKVLVRGEIRAQLTWRGRVVAVLSRENQQCRTFWPYSLMFAQQSPPRL
jgi:hypothetical protein